MKRNIFMIFIVLFFLMGCSLNDDSGTGMGQRPVSTDKSMVQLITPAKALPDLVVTSVTASTPQIDQGDELIYSYTVKNTGAEGPSGNSTFDVAAYLSKDIVFDASDIELVWGYSVWTYHLSSGWTKSHNDSALIPSTVPDGHYYLIVVADAKPGLPPNYYPGVTESNETNNWKVKSSTIYIGNIYSIGDIGPAGGFIFYDKGNYSDGWRYLEAAPNDLHFLYGGVTERWQVTTSTHTYVGSTKTDVGSGKNNTTLIVNALGAANPYYPYVASACNDLVLGEYDDWFLPSKEELFLMYQNLAKNGLGNFSAAYPPYPDYPISYWSSSEDSQNYAWGQRFDLGQIIQIAYYKSSLSKVRAARMF